MGEDADLYARQLAAGELTQDQYDRKMEEIRQGAVTISTIHSAKGLEWKRVFVTNLYEGSLPIDSQWVPTEKSRKNAAFSTSLVPAPRILWYSAYRNLFNLKRIGSPSSGSLPPGFWKKSV